jgi:hypothetical protein
MYHDLGQRGEVPLMKSIRISLATISDSDRIGLREGSREAGKN